MQKNNNKKHSFCKGLGLICAMVLLVCALYVPVVFGASALNSVAIVDDTSVVFDFENVATSAENTAAKDNDGIGYYGWGPGVATLTDADGNKNNVLQSHKYSTEQHWGTSGAYRLNKRLEDGTVGVYELAPSSKYVVAFKLRVVSPAVALPNSNTAAKSTIGIGYNCIYDPNMNGQGGNYINGMKNRTTIVEVLMDSEAFTLYDDKGVPTSYPYSEEWINVRYFINTPAEFSADPALAFWTDKYHGFKAEIDDVSVTKIGAESGMVFLVDEYSGKEELVIGKIGAEVTLPDIKDRAQSADHAFEGWYTDKDRTQKAEKVSFAADVQFIYSRWKAPVSITFKDNLNGTEKTITGSAGDKFEYPADPVNPANTSWFMGWYTDEGFTNEHKSGKFGYANQTLYAYFKGRIPGLSEDFENYTKDSYTVKTGDNGQAFKSNRLIFGATLKKQNEVAYGDKGYAVKFHWNPTPIDDKNNEHYYDVTRYTAKDNYFQLDNTLENGAQYVVSFKYKAEKVNAPVNFYMLSSIKDNGWGGARVEYVGINGFAIKQSDEWQEISFNFTPAYKSTGNYVYLGVSLTQNEETIIYFDDVKIEAFAQPYESVAIINNGIDKEATAVKGKRGEKIELPKLTHPMDAELKGWYLDSEFTTPAPEVPVFTRGEIKLFAKWLGYTGFNQGFEEYTKDEYTVAEYNKTYDANNTPKDTTDDVPYKAAYKNNYLYFYTTMSKQSNVVKSGNYAIKFNWNTDPSTDKEMKPNGKNVMNADSYEHSRYSADDNYFFVGKGLENNQVYTVSFKYKVEKGNQDVKFYLLTGVENNAWGNRVIYSAPENTTLKVGDWQEYSFEFTTKMKGANDSVFLGIKLTENKDTIVYFDDVKIKSVLNTEQVYLFINNGYEGDVKRHIGIKGEKIQFPALDHPDDAPFLGWFTDEELTTPFTLETYPTTNVSIFGGWGYAPMGFKSYKYEGHAYSDPFINRETAKGLGNGDNHAMHWKLKRVKDNDTGVGTSQSFLIYKGIETGKVYKISYDYKVNNVSTNGTIDVRGYDSTNIWWSGVMVNYNSVPVIKGNKTGWQTQEFYMVANVREANGYQKSDDLFIRFSFLETSAAGTDMDILIDNVAVELVEAPYVFFDGQNGKEGSMVRGEAGEEIKIPKDPTRIGYAFDGWYMDKECTVKYNLEKFEADTAVNVYAKWKESNTAVYSFENYTEVEGSGWHFRDGKVVSDKARSGKYSMYFGNRSTGKIASHSLFIIEDSGEDYQLEKSRQYIITLYYYVKSYGKTSFNIGWQATSYDNYYVSANHKNGNVAVNQPITTAEAAANKGKWAKKSFAVDTTILTEKGVDHKQLLAVITGGLGWEIYFDDVTITKVPKGQSAVVFDTMSAKGCPDYVIGKEGASYASKVPEKMSLGDLYFKGYYVMSVDGSWQEKERDAMTFGPKAETLFGRFLDKHVAENFDGDYYDLAYGKEAGYTIHDFDYEVYDSEKEGNSKDNVTSGRYSMHRKGNSMFKENACILTVGNQIAEGERYRVTMKVKLGKHFHTDGAIKVASGRSYEYAWTTTGDYYAVAPIATLKEGEWMEVSYVFNSVESFLVLQTPGYVELFIDDIEFELVGDGVALSEPPVYTEYVGAERDKDGNLLKIDRTAVDVSTIIDKNLTEGNSIPWIWIIIGAAAVLVIAGGVVAFTLISKKKSNKA